jgi:hypothetical protein
VALHVLLHMREMRNSVTSEELGSTTVLARAHWMLRERRCCPFLTLSLECQPEGELWMRTTGPEGTKDALRAELRAER